MHQMKFEKDKFRKINKVVYNAIFKEKKYFCKLKKRISFLYKKKENNAYYRKNFTDYWPSCRC